MKLLTKGLYIVITVCKHKRQIDNLGLRRISGLIEHQIRHLRTLSSPIGQKKRSLTKPSTSFIIPFQDLPISPFKDLDVIIQFIYLPSFWYMNHLKENNPLIQDGTILDNEEKLKFILDSNSYSNDKPKLISTKGRLDPCKRIKGSILFQV